jgi:hypothetical protein
MRQFDYLLKKIADAPFETTPFRHVEIENFLSEEHFDAVVGSPQIAFSPAETTEDLLKTLAASGYTVIPFPGCVTSTEEYLKWFNTGSGRRIHGATEGFGIVCRLTDFRDAILGELNRFLVSPEMQKLLRDKFAIEAGTVIDAGLQKYLHGYEISPHPDIRRKALTWMLNVNPAPNSEAESYHTHYLTLKDRWRFISEFWKHNPEVDRDWVPWDWCDTVKMQRKNNSIVLFSPADDTIHAVKANYNHLPAQRTQFYGNLWYEPVPLPKVDFQSFDLRRAAQSTSSLGALKASPVGAAIRFVKNQLGIGSRRVRKY